MSVRTFLLVATVGVLAWTVPALGQTMPAGAKFSDVTKGSGLDDLYARTGKNYWGSGIHFVDLDGDGNLDFYLSAHGRGKGQAVLGDGRGHFRPTEGIVPQTEIHLVYDINEDGKADLSVNFNDGGAQWWLNRSEVGKLHFELQEGDRRTNQARQNVMVDINRDGKVDWLRGAQPGVWFDLGDGKGVFPRGNSLTVEGSGGQGEDSVMAADLCGQGNIDLVVEWGRYGKVKGCSRLYRNDGEMKFTDITVEAGLRVDDFSVKAIGDYNQDGVNDLLVLENMKTFEVYLNDGQGHFKKQEGALKNVGGPAPRYASWGLGTMTDLDNDSKPDILVDGKHFLKILRGNGDGTYTYMNGAWAIKDIAKSAVDEGLCFGDVDNDGMLDMAGYTAFPEEGNWNAPFALYHNDLPKLNWVRVRPVGLAGNRGAAGAKISLYEAGGLGDKAKRIWFEQVQIVNRQSVQNYYGLAQTERHMGLGLRNAVDVAIEFYPSGKKVEARGVHANRIVTIEEETGKATERELGR